MAKRKKLPPQEVVRIPAEGGRFPCDVTFELCGERWNGIAEVIAFANTPLTFAPDNLSGANWRKLKHSRKVLELRRANKRRELFNGRRCRATDSTRRVPCFDSFDYATDWRMIHTITMRGNDGEEVTIFYTDESYIMDIHPGIRTSHFAIV